VRSPPKSHSYAFRSEKTERKADILEFNHHNAQESPLRYGHIAN